MSVSKGRILIVDDEQDVRELLTLEFSTWILNSFCDKRQRCHINLD